MPKGAQKTKFIPHHDGASGNLPKIGEHAPGVYSGGTRPTSSPNTTGGVFVPKKASGSSSGQAPGNQHRSPPNPY